MKTKPSEYCESCEKKEKIYEKELWKFSNTCTLDNLEFISFSSWHFNHILGSIHLAASFSTKRFFCTRNPKRYGQFNSLSTLKAMFVDSHKEHVASILTQHCPPFWDEAGFCKVEKVQILGIKYLRV